MAERQHTVSPVTTIYASPRPQSEVSESHTATLIEELLSSPKTHARGDRTMSPTNQDLSELPDHVCNYCKTLHWYSGPRMTPCPPGFKLSKSKRQKGSDSARQPPKDVCRFCKTLHWYAGRKATPCPRKSSKVRVKREHIVERIAD